MALLTPPQYVNHSLHHVFDSLRWGIDTPPTLHCHVKAQRERLGLRPSELARLTGITRQALHAVETGRYVPSTLIALHLARVLGCPVETLFELHEPSVTARLVGEAPALPTRVQLAQVGPHLLAFPLTGGRALRTPADGTVRAPAQDQTVQVELTGPLDLSQRTAVLAGCDPSLELFVPHLARSVPDVRLAWHPMASFSALQALGRQEAHAAGIHLWDAPSGTSNLPFVQALLPGRPTHLFTLWSWEQGLIVAPGNPLGLTGAADLVRPGIRLVNREDGAGSRLLLDAWLDAAGVTPAGRRHLTGYDTEATSHLDLAGRIAVGQADAGPGPRSAAQALGLAFVPLQVERFDLVVPDEHLDHPALRALLDVARSDAFRAELQTLGGYDPSHAGELWRTGA